VKKFLCIVFVCTVGATACGRSGSTSPAAPTSAEATTHPSPARLFPATGPDIVADVAARYPERLVAGISPEERLENMTFLRDRIIETGLCGGMQLGRNLKRGGPDVSNDFLAWRRDDGDMGVDIGFSYDDTSQPLRLQWLEVGMGATYQEYPAPSCD
jgi:hypothetical protein